MGRTPVQRVAHHGHRLLVWLGGVAAILILIAAAGFWRLLSGPVELDRLVPLVEQALQHSGVGVAIAGVSIGVDPDTHQLDLRARNVQLSLPNGEKLANFPEMATSFSLAAMLKGRIEPTRLVVEHPVLALTRDASGALSLRVGNPGAAADESGPQNALALFTPLRPDTPWSRLRQITIRDATILVNDRMSGRVWRADRAAATLQRTPDGATGDVSFAVALGNNTPELHATYRYAAQTRQFDVELALAGLDPAALVPLSPVLAPLAKVQFPVSGTANFRFDAATGAAEGGRLDLGFGAGEIDTDLLANGKLPVAQGELHADYAPEAAELRLERLALDLQGGTTLVVTGKLDGLQPQLVSTDAPLPTNLAGSLGVMVTHVPIGRVPALWPAGVSPGGRKWVAANLADGTLDEMAVRLGVKFDPAAMSADFVDPQGTMRYHDLTVDYFNGLPPVKKVSGTATLDGRRLDFALAGGLLRSLKATGGAVSITDIGAPVETLAVDVGLSGPLQDALEVLDAKPLHYVHEAGIDPTRVGGKLDAQLHFKLPLLAGVKLADVDYGAKATLGGVSYQKVAFDRPLTDGNFALDLGHDGVHAKGGGKFDGTSATIDGNLYFHPKTGPRINYRIGLTLDDAARERLGWDLAEERVSGPVALDLDYVMPKTGTRSEVDANLDLRDTRLVLAEAGWQKPPSAPGSAKMVVALDDDVVVGIPEIDIRAAGLDGRFAVALNPEDRSLEQVNIRRLIVADDDFSGTVSRREGGGWQAEIRGARIDVHQAAKRALESDKPTSVTPLAINAHVGELVLGPHRVAHNVSAMLLRDRGSWQTINIDGHFANGHAITLTLGGGRLHVASDDLGASFALFGIADNVVGGRLTVDGTAGELDGHQMLRAHVEGADYRLVRGPALAQLLSLTSLDGIAAIMSGTGIPFTNLRGDVGFSRGVITLQRVIAYGGALGINVKGWLNPGEDRIDVDGTLAPAYALNSVLANFPVLGSLLMGGEGQGLFAARFHLGGLSDDPTVTVNPLSALTPGLLRHLFDPLSDLDQPGAAPPAAAETATPQHDGGH